MLIKNLIIGIFATALLSGCAQNAALLGPAYTLAASGNAYQAGFTYGSNELVTKVTGKSTVQNIKDALAPKKKNTEFEKLVKKNIEETRKKLKLSNQ
jgi:hypothetical protein|tara:strand:- start:292 stop:582 length:291 start_codon:yes stop_codon:yes gene_type:complete